MKKLLLISFVVIIGLVSAGCKISVGLGEEFFLSPGKGAVISSEHFEITFKEVVEDSRCAKGVTCVWEGRAVNRVRIISYNTDVELELIEPGLTDQDHSVIFSNYMINFHLLPYPEVDVETSKGDYLLRLTINKLR